MSTTTATTRPSCAPSSTWARRSRSRSWPKASRTEEQFNFLRGRGCHYAQGRLFGDADERRRIPGAAARAAERPRQSRAAVRVRRCRSGFSLTLSYTSLPCSPFLGPLPAPRHAAADLRRVLHDLSRREGRHRRRQRLRQIQPARADARRAARRRRQLRLPVATVVAHVAQEMAAHRARAIEFVHRRRRRAARDRSSDRCGRSAATPVLRSASCTPATPRSAATTRAAAPRSLHARSRILRRGRNATRSRRSPAAGACGSISRRR